MSIKTSAIIAAAGNGTRMKSNVSKQFIKLGELSVLERTISVFEATPEIDEIIIATRESDMEEVGQTVRDMNAKKVSTVICGGDTRQETIYKALQYVSGEYVLIHDGARPFVTEEQIGNVAKALLENDGAALGIPVTDTLKSVENGYIKGTVDRAALVSILTPQGFKTEVIKKAHKEATEKGLSVTDDCALCEIMGISIKVVEGSSANIKITTPEDLAIGESILRKRGLKI